MTKVSRIPVDPPKMGWIINNFWNAITLLDDKDKIKLFLKDILSLVEMKMIAKRLQIAKMLLEENDYLTIRNYTRVTDGTIAKIQNQLARAGDGYREAVKCLQEIEREFSGESADMLRALSPRGGGIIDGVGKMAEKKLRKLRKKRSVKKNILSSL